MSRATVSRGTKAKPAPPPLVGIAKVSHTMPHELADRLRRVAFFQRVSESAIIEVALERLLLDCGNDEKTIGDEVRAAGHGMRRR